MNIVRADFSLPIYGWDDFRLILFFVVFVALFICGAILFLRWLARRGRMPFWAFIVVTLILTPPFLLVFLVDANETADRWANLQCPQSDTFCKARRKLGELGVHYLGGHADRPCPTCPPGGGTSLPPQQPQSSQGPLPPYYGFARGIKIAADSHLGYKAQEDRCANRGHSFYYYRGENPNHVEIAHKRFSFFNLDVLYPGSMTSGGCYTAARSRVSDGDYVSPTGEVQEEAYYSFLTSPRDDYSRMDIHVTFLREDTPRGQNTTVYEPRKISVPLFSLDGLPLYDINASIFLVRDVRFDPDHRRVLFDLASGVNRFGVGVYAPWSAEELMQVFSLRQVAQSSGEIVPETTGTYTVCLDDELNPYQVFQGVRACPAEYIPDPNTPVELIDLNPTDGVPDPVEDFIRSAYGGFPEPEVLREVARYLKTKIDQPTNLPALRYATERVSPAIACLTLYDAAAAEINFAVPRSAQILDQLRVITATTRPRANRLKIADGTLSGSGFELPPIEIVNQTCPLFFESDLDTHHRRVNQHDLEQLPPPKLACPSPQLPTFYLNGVRTSAENALQELWSLRNTLVAHSFFTNDSLPTERFHLLYNYSSKEKTSVPVFGDPGSDVDDGCEALQILKENYDRDLFLPETRVRQFEDSYRATGANINDPSFTSDAIATGLARELRERLAEFNDDWQVGGIYAKWLNIEQKKLGSFGYRPDQHISQISDATQNVPGIVVGYSEGSMFAEEYRQFFAAGESVRHGNGDGTEDDTKLFRRILVGTPINWDLVGESARTGEEHPRTYKINHPNDPMANMGTPNLDAERCVRIGLPVAARVLGGLFKNGQYHNFSNSENEDGFQYVNYTKNSRIPILVDRYLNHYSELAGWNEECRPSFAH